MFITSGTAHEDGLSISSCNYTVTVKDQHGLIFVAVENIASSKVKFPLVIKILTSVPIIWTLLPVLAEGSSLLLPTFFMAIIQFICMIMLKGHWKLIAPAAIYISLSIAYFAIIARSYSPSLARFHAVEHMVINCITSGKELNHENVANSSRFSHKCGSIIGVSRVFSGIACCLLLTKTSSWFLIILAGQMLGLEVAIFINTHNFKTLNHLACLPQKWLLEEPTDHEIEIGLIAGRRLLALEQATKVPVLD